MALAGALGVRTDPLVATNFAIMLLDTSSSTAALKSLALSALGDLLLGGFSECTGLEIQLDLDEHREGGNNGTVLQFPKQIKWGRITLKKGMGYGSALWDWHYGFVQGNGKRRDGVILLMDFEQNPAQAWYFRRGLPVRYSAPPLNAVQSAVAIESIEIAHEGILQFSALGTVINATTGGLSGGF